MIKIKSESLLKAFLIIAIALFAVLLVGCGVKEVTELRLSLTNSSKLSYSPGETVNLTIEANAEFDENNITLVVTNGNSDVTIMGSSLKINEDAQPGQTITLYATYGEIISNTLTFSVAHIEANEITLNIDQDVFYSSEIIALSATYLPTNATRPLEYTIVEGQDKASIIDGNRLSINGNAQTGDKIRVCAKMGEVYSEPFEIAVTALTDNMISGFMFNNSSLTIDSSIDSLSQSIYISAYVGDDFREITTNLPTLTVAEGEDVIRIIDNNHIEALNSGSATISAKYKNFEEQQLTVTVNMTPDQVRLPENFREVADYNYAHSQAIEFSPSIINSHGSEDLKMMVSGTLNATFLSEDGVWRLENGSQDISYDGKELTINTIGDYEIYFESLSGCAVEVQSPKMTLSINNGTNVSTKEEFISALSPREEAVVNLTCDIFFEGGSEVVNAYGDKTINGNGFKIDLSSQLTDAEMAEKGLDYGSSCFLNFYSNDNTTPYNVLLQDLEIVGNVGMLSLEEFAKYKGDSEEEVNNHLTSADTDYFTETGYKRALNFSATNSITPDGNTAYTYCVPVVKNVTISQFTCGISFEHCIDEIALGIQNPRAAIEDVTLFDLFGDGVRCMGSKISAGDVNIGTVGGSPFSCSATDTDLAGIYRNENNKFIILGNIICDNIIDGSGLYVNAEIMATGGIANVFGGGLSGIINTAITAMSAELMQPYYGTANESEMYQTINEGRSNILNTQGSSNTFNLFCFTRNGIGEYQFSEDNSALIVDLNDEFFYNGIDTTHKFIKVNVYDVVMSIETLGAIRDQVIANADAIKPINIILINLNYQG